MLVICAGNIGTNLCNELR